MIRAVVDASLETGRVTMEEDALEAMNDLRNFMFARVYLRPETEVARRKVVRIVRDLVDHYVEHPDQVPATYRHDDADAVTQVIDYVAGMTDRFAIRIHDDLFRPRLFD